jgi:DNA-binding beta-propeller fold protein YncE
MRLRLGIVLGVLALAGSPAAHASLGELALPGGCIEQAPQNDAGCAAGQALTGASGVAISPDGHDVYVVSNDTNGFGWGAVEEFGRDAATGRLSQIGCVSSDGSTDLDGTTGSCAVAAGLRGAQAIAISPDGLHVYVGTNRATGVVQFARDPASGKLTEAGCLVQAQPVGSSCLPALVFQDETALAVSADSNWVYGASSARGAVSALGASTFGFATPGGGSPLLLNPCIAIAGEDDDCANADALKSADGIALSGGTLLVTSAGSGAVDSFAANPTTGALTQTGCLVGSAPPGPCQSSGLLSQPTAIAVSPDGLSVYVIDSDPQQSYTADLIVLARNPTTGVLSDVACYEGPDNGSDDGTDDAPRARAAQSDPCTQVAGLTNVATVGVSADGSTVYTAGDGTFAAFSRGSDGRLQQTDCLGSDPGCGDLTGGAGLDALAVSPDGSDVYAVSSSDASIIAVAQGASITSATVRVSADGSATVSIACPRRMHRACAGTLGLAPESAAGGAAHAASLATRATVRVRAGSTRSARVTLSPALRRRLAAHGRVVVEAVFAPVAGGGGAAARSVTLL